MFISNFNFDSSGSLSGTQSLYLLSTQPRLPRKRPRSTGRHCGPAAPFSLPPPCDAFHMTHGDPTDEGWGLLGTPGAGTSSSCGGARVSTPHLRRHSCCGPGHLLTPTQ